MREKDRIKKDQKVIKDTDRKKKDLELMTEEERDQYFADCEKRENRENSGKKEMHAVRKLLFWGLQLLSHLL